MWDADIAAVGALLAEPARCRMLLALADGRALPASALAREAHVAASTASGHLGRLVDAGWVEVEAHGRYRYYRLVNDTVADVMELASQLVLLPPVDSLSGDLERQRLRRARTCYHHLAGRLGVAVLEVLLHEGTVTGHDGSFRPGVDQLSATGRDLVYQVTERGAERLAGLGVELAPGTATRHCVDWTEQRHHLSGDLGRQLADRFFALGWIERRDVGRAVTITEKGARALTDELGIAPTTLDPS